MSFIICKLAVNEGKALVHYMQSNMQWTVDEGKAFRIMSESAAEAMLENEPEAWAEQI
ncbi:hypothetical protein D3C85_979220 [compost metagenome]